MIEAVLHEAGIMAGWSARLAVAAIFLEAAQHALSDRQDFAGVVAAYRIAPVSWAEAVGVALPGLQILAAVALMVPRLAVPGAGLALALLLLFTAAITLNLLRGRTNIDCGCGGESQRISYALVMRNLVLAAAAAGALAAPVHVHFGAAFTVGAAGFAVFLTGLYFAANQLMGNAQAFRAMARGFSA
jgi:hypothetical protein